MNELSYRAYVIAHAVSYFFGGNDSCKRVAVTNRFTNSKNVRYDPVSL